jgi:hypothetical protein
MNKIADDALFVRQLGHATLQFRNNEWTNSLEYKSRVNISVAKAT